MIRELGKRETNRRIAARKKYGTTAAAAAALGLPDSTLRCWLNKPSIKPLWSGEGVEEEKKKKGATKGRGMSLSDFAEQHDPDTRTRVAIRMAVRRLKDDSIYLDSDFRMEMCSGAPASGWRAIADESEFRPYQFRCKTKIYWANVRTVGAALERIRNAREL